MKHPVPRLLIATAFLFLMEWAGAEEARPPSVPQRPIPYKTEPTPVEEQGTRTALVLVLLLLATGIGLYVVRKRVPGLVGLVADSERLRIIERIRLNPRCTLYLVQLDGRELLIAQCADNVVQLNTDRSAPLAAPPPEAQHG